MSILSGADPGLVGQGKPEQGEQGEPVAPLDAPLETLAGDDDLPADFAEDDDGDYYEDGGPPTVLNLPPDTFLYEIFPFLKVVTILHKVIFVSREFFQLGWLSLAERHVKLNPCVLLRVKTYPSETLLARLFASDVVSRADANWMPFFIKVGFSRLFRNFWTASFESSALQIQADDLTPSLLGKSSVRRRKGKGGDDGDDPVAPNLWNWEEAVGRPEEKKAFLTGLLTRAASCGNIELMNLVFKDARTQKSLRPQGGAHNRDQKYNLEQQMFSSAFRYGRTDVIGVLLRDYEVDDIATRRWADWMVYGAAGDAKAKEDRALAVLETIFSDAPDSVVEKFAGVDAGRDWHSGGCDALGSFAQHRMLRCIKRVVQERIKRGWRASMAWSKAVEPAAPADSPVSSVSRKEAHELLSQGSAFEELFVYAFDELKADPVLKPGLVERAVGSRSEAIMKRLRSDSRVDFWAKNDIFLQACSGGSLGFVKELLQLKPDAKDDAKLMTQALVEVLSVPDNGELMDFFLSESKANPMLKVPRRNWDRGGKTPLMRAVVDGREKSLARLLKDPRVDPAADESEVLKVACESESTGIVALLLKDGRADPNASNMLKVAVENLRADVVRLLVEDGRADVTYDRFSAVRFLHSITEGMDADRIARAMKILAPLLQDKRMKAFFQPSGL